MASSSEPHLYLVDGSGYIFRAYHALPPMSRSDGTPVNAVLGFSNMLFKLLEDLNEGERPSHLAVIFDAAKRSFRNDIFGDYKANRPDPPEDLIPQFPLIRDAVRAFSVPSIEIHNYEADDVIATYARQAREAGWRVTIVSSDKDLMQLVDDRVDMLDTMKSRRIGPAEVVEKFGVGPDKVIDVQALAGDSVDNVPGVPGIGVKTAAQLINDYGDLDALLARAEEIKQPKRRQNLIENAEMARLSRRLVTLDDQAPVEVALDALGVRDPEPEPLLAFVDAQEFRSLKTKVLAHLGDAAPEADALRGELDMGGADYECVTDMAALNRWIAAIEKAGMVAVDTETTGLDAVAADLVGLSLSIEAGKACYVPVGHTGSDGDGLGLDGGRPDQLDKDAVVAALKPVLEDPGILKIGQNIKYDLIVFAKVGIHVAPIDDTMLISYALECGLHGHGMDELSDLHLGHRPVSFKEVAGTGKNQITFDRVGLDKATHYAAEDADITGRLHRVLKPRLVEARLTTVYETLERPLVPVLAAMEMTGIKVDRAQLARLSADFAQGMERLEGEIHGLAGHPFNIGSPKQLGEVLFDEMGLTGGKKGKSGAYSTDVNVLERLAGEGHDLPARVLDWRQLSKLKSTYTDALQKEINPDTGRVHTSFHLASTSTGRLSSNDPNLQNIPVRTEQGRKIRQAFVAEAGCKLIAADYSQIELRILAHIAGIDALREAFAQGHDIHAMTAAQVFGVPMEGMDPIVRRQAKAINFGIIYGISAFGLARQLGIANADAKAYIDAYFERFPGIRDYMDRTKRQAHEAGFVETVFGRRCHIRAIGSKNPAERSFGERAAINAPIQGSAADIIRRAMARMPAALNDAGLSQARMLLQVHDELIFEVPEAAVEDAAAVIKRTMEGAADPALELSVPLTVDTGVGDNWDEAH